MNNKVYILLDRSGSMRDMWDEAIGGINGYVRALEFTDVMLATFDSMSYEVVRNSTSESWVPVTTTEIFPRGMTPLLDASGRIMQNMIDSGAKRAILVVVTDGNENSSTKYSKAEIAAMTTKITKELDYEMVFLGANFDKVGDVAKSNYNFHNVANFSSRISDSTPGNFGATMYATASATRSYLVNGKSDNFYTDEFKIKEEKSKK